MAPLAPVTQPKVKRPAKLQADGEGESSLWGKEAAIMTKSELIARLAEANPHLYQRDVERIVSTIFDEIGAALAP